MGTHVLKWTQGSLKLCVRPVHGTRSSTRQPCKELVLFVDLGRMCRRQDVSTVVTRPPQNTLLGVGGE
jgi:hypothetical protein